MIKVTDRRVSAWRERHPEDKHLEWDLYAEEPRTIVVLDRESETVETGLLDKDGRSIHRKTMQSIGFVRFD